MGEIQELRKRVAELEELNRKLAGDNAELTRSKETLNETEAKFSALFMAMEEMAAIHELVFDEAGIPVDYRLVECNEAYHAITGIQVSDAIGRKGSEVYGSFPPPYFEEFSGVAISGIPRHISVYYAPIDKYLSISIVSPGKNKFATITVDITDLERFKETLTRKNRELENYLYIASHDLRAPLVNIQGFCSRLKNEMAAIKDVLSSLGIIGESQDRLIKAGENIPHTLEFIISNVRTMDNLINGLLTLSRTGRVSLTVAKIDMQALFSGLLERFGYQLDEVGARITVGPIDDCYGDETLVMQLFSNLVANALKYRDPARPLEIRIDSEQKPHSVVYTIGDTGIGIAQRHLERVFDVFYRVRRDDSVPGEGIGLSIVKRIVDVHRGTIRVESDEGKGSRFFVELPSKAFSVD